ncbi:MAG: putative alpha/beta superfamily hydrolase, partial [Polaribacter sp.]
MRVIPIITKVLIAFLMFLQYNAFGQNATPYSIGNTYKIHSKILKEERNYILELPSSYETSKNNYPILVLLDGEVNYHSHSGILKHMIDGRQIPEMIIVAITNVDRVKDFTPTKYLTNLNGSSALENHKTSGGSSHFLNFIEEELLPEIDKNYRTNSFKTLVGISHGGLLVGSSYLSNTSSFNGFVSMDPSFWWDNQYVVKQINSANLSQIKDKRIYVSTADKFENFDRVPHVFKANINSHELFNTTLKNKGISPSNIELEYFKEENHWTVALMSLYNGMQFIYKGLKMKNMSNNSIDEIVSYYKTNYNGAFLPPENDINTIGYEYLKKDKKKALAFFKLNATNYPTSSNAFDSLGEVYMLLGDKK